MPSGTGCVLDVILANLVFCTCIKLSRRRGEIKVLVFHLCVPFLSHRTQIVPTRHFCVILRGCRRLSWDNGPTSAKQGIRVAFETPIQFHKLLHEHLFRHEDDKIFQAPKFVKLNATIVFSTKYRPDAAVPISMRCHKMSTLGGHNSNSTLLVSAST